MPDHPSNSVQPGPIVIVVAVSENGVIGRDGGLPWRLPKDLKHFKAVTMGKPIIMGRRTYAEELGKPLPGRLNIVITRDRGWSHEGVVVAHGLDEALDAAHARQPGIERCVIGGGEIYRLATRKACRIELTRVHAQIEGDTTFESPDPSIWKRDSIDLHGADDSHAHSMSFETWSRR